MAKTLKEGWSQTINWLWWIIKEPFNWAKEVLNPLIVQNAKNVWNILPSSMRENEWKWLIKWTFWMTKSLIKNTAKAGVWLWTNTLEASIRTVVPAKNLSNIYSHWMDTIWWLAEMSKTVFSWPSILLDKLALNHIYSINQKLAVA